MVKKTVILETSFSVVCIPENSRYPSGTVTEAPCVSNQVVTALGNLELEIQKVGQNRSLFPDAGQWTLPREQRRFIRCIGSY